MQIEITFPSGKKKIYTYGVKTENVIDHCYGNGMDRGSGKEIVAARLNNELVSLSYPITINSFIEPVSLDSPEGTILYKRTLCFLLSIAAKKLFPERRLIIGHSLGEGYYYYFEEYDHVSGEDIASLTDCIRQLVQHNYPIQHNVISYMEAIEYFKKDNQPHTALLLKYQNRTKIHIYQCGEYIDLMHGPMLSYTGLLSTFEIRDYSPGFLLRFPKQAGLKNIPPLKTNLVLFSIYQEYKTWGKILNMNCLGLLNQLINQGNIKEFIQVVDALHDKKIANIADRIKERLNTVKLVLIAGPSSSGKTTFSKKLAIQLKVLGIKPVTISLDNYFLPRDEAPQDEDGNPDLESIEAIDTELLNKNLIKLLKGKSVEIPHFDFVAGRRRDKGFTLDLTPDSIMIIEGIHGLNDRLTEQIRREQKFKIYISALTQLNLDDHNRISTTDNRLIRRMVRDSQFRGHSALDTLQMWPSVVKGENKNIFPFQDTADVAFNSSLDYELSVLKIYSDSLLRTIKPDTREYSEARRLLSFLDNFLPIPPAFVPSQSILREFIGESEFEY